MLTGRCERGERTIRKMEKKVVDSVPEFPYACAVQYRQVRGRTLLPGSGWDRVLPRRYGRLTRTMHGWLVYNFFSNAIEPDSAGIRKWACYERSYSYIPRITKPRVESGSRSMALDIGKGACMIGGRPLYDGHHRRLRRSDRRSHRSGSLGRGGPQIFPQHSSHVFHHNLRACPFCTTYSSRSSMVPSI